LRRLVIVLLLFASACYAPELVEPHKVGAEQSTNKPEPTRYDNLLRYVPTNMESVLVFDISNQEWPEKIRNVYAHRVRRGVLAGRKFLFPSREGIGGFEGVILLETEGTCAELVESQGKSEKASSYGNFDIRRLKSDGELLRCEPNG